MTRGSPSAASPDGEAQRWDPARYARNAGFVAALGEALIDLLKPLPGERILDLGCGDGALTEKVAATGATIVAVDASDAQVAASRARGLDARVMDGQALAFDGEFDGVLSNAALHWMRRPDAVIDGVWRALKPGGRFVAEMGGAGNVAKITRALVAALDRRGIDGAAAAPWYFPTAEEQSRRLAARGFDVLAAELFARPTPLPGDVTGWLETFAESFTNRLPPAERPGFLGEVAAALAPELRDGSGTWIADYVRLRFIARKPAI
ncbi:MAG: methyltransferase type 11 [Alphaproteobacteria bacterium]|nr:MAG: methyltransferase type 11 [Alphaproteobacteria bacterium]